MDSPHAVSHLLLCLCSVIESQLGHLTADALKHGQKFPAGAQHLVAALAFKEVRHHLRQLGVADWARWRYETTSQTGELLTCLDFKT